VGEELRLSAEQPEIARRTQEVHEVGAEHAGDHEIRRLGLQRRHVRGEVGGAELGPLLADDHDVRPHYLEVRNEILGEVLAVLVVGRDRRHALDVGPALQVLGHDAADLDRGQVGAADVRMTRLPGEPLRRREPADHEHLVLPTEIADRDRGAAVDADGHELDLLLEDHPAGLGDRLLDLAAHVGGDELEGTALEAAGGVRLVHRDLEAGADRVGDEREAAAVDVDQAELDRLAAPGRLGVREQRKSAERHRTAQHYRAANHS
jgi:hypothetical protein